MSYLSDHTIFFPSQSRERVPLNNLIHQPLYVRTVCVFMYMYTVSRKRAQTLTSKQMPTGGVQVGICIS
jgi:hypothetical protein